MRVRNFTGLVGVILIIYTLRLYYYKCRLIRNDQDLGDVFIEFSMLVRNLIGPVRVILVIYKHCQYYDKCWLIRNDQDLENVFL